MYYVYIIKSEKDLRYYYGFSGNIGKRLGDHNSGRVKATRHRRPFVLHYLESYAEKIDAQKREKFFKKRSGHKWLGENNII